MSTAQATERRAIDAYAVALDETEFYHLDPTDARYIARIDGVYLFDRNEHTYCCELTPSYFLIYLYTSIIFTDNADDDVQEELDEKYAHEPHDAEYVHYGDMEKIIADNKCINHYGDAAPHDQEDIEDIDQRHDAELEAIREDLCSNCPF